MKARLHRALALAAFLAVRATAAAEGSVEFGEIWAYLMKGEEAFLDASYPISDIGYFGASIDAFGNLVGVPDPANISFFPGRKHLVVAEVTNAALTHFCLNPAYPVRDRLVAQIAEAAAPFDGVQIDFEKVHPADRDNFVEFLTLVRAAIGNRTLTVALPARVRKVDDPYDYARIGPIVDRIIVMAYDEHWSGSVPGSIASIDWCRDVARFAMREIGAKKLVMGLPFYGRAWADRNLSKAYKHSSLERIKAEKNIAEVERRADIPYFQYQETVTVQVYYEDAKSVYERARVYRAGKVSSISFWRLGQEDPEVWKRLRLSQRDARK